MKHPSEYITEQFCGVHVMVVDPGSVIKDERSGQEMVVTDDSCVFKGNIAYCTKPVFEKIKARTTPRDSPTPPSGQPRTGG